MKKIITICAAILLTASMFAQSPNKMSYQAVIRNTSNALVTNSAVGMRISILQTTSSGTAVYIETHSPTTNANGLASIEIGGGTIVSGSFASINWANGPYFIKTETDPSGGTNYSITGTSQLLSVPYALYAANAGTATGGGNFTHYIGEEFGGGVIFHLWKDTLGLEHGLIVDKTDLSSGINWSNVSTTLIALPTTDDSWNGIGNSNSIVSQTGHLTSAAQLCLNSNNSNQSDWYLPSIQELNILWNNYFTVAKSLSQIPGATLLSPIYYWSSTEYLANLAWYFYFGSGSADGYDVKSGLNYVRAIRQF
jgi:hypothetical protein